MPFCSTSTAGVPGRSKVLQTVAKGRACGRITVADCPPGKVEELRGGQGRLQGGMGRPQVQEQHGMAGVPDQLRLPGEGSAVDGAVFPRFLHDQEGMLLRIPE